MHPDGKRFPLRDEDPLPDVKLPTVHRERPLDVPLRDPLLDTALGIWRTIATRARRLFSLRLVVAAAAAFVVFLVVVVKVRPMREVTSKCVEIVEESDAAPS